MPAVESVTSKPDPKPLTVKWWAENIAAITIAGMLFAFLGLLQYAQLVKIPIRIHAGLLSGLLPWLIASQIIQLAIPLVIIVVCFATARLKVNAHGHSLVSPPEAAAAQDASHKGEPAKVAPNVLGTLAKRICFFGAPALLSAILWLLVQQYKPSYAWPISLGANLLSVLVLRFSVTSGITGRPSTYQMLTLIPYLFLSSVILIAAILAVNGALIGTEISGAPAIALSICTVLGCSFIAAMPEFFSQHRLVAIFLIFGSMILSVTSISALSTRSTLRTLGLGGEIAYAYTLKRSAGDKRDERANERAQPSSAPPANSSNAKLNTLQESGNVTLSTVYTERHLLLLDTGSELHVRKCDATPESPVEVLRWSNVVEYTPLPLESSRCASRQPDTARGLWQLILQ